MTGNKMLFAGIRFAISGVIILAVAAATKRSFAMATSGSWCYLVVYALLNTTLHYTFFYIACHTAKGQG